METRCDGALIEETATGVGRWERELIKGMEDSTRFGPANAIVGAMLNEGVELSGQTAVNAWIRELNARSETERQNVLP